MFLLLAKRYSDRGNFNGYSWKDDMRGEAVYTCLKYMHNFNVDIDNPNPFAYFSRIIHNSFLNYISKQKKHSSIKDICYKNLEKVMMNEPGLSESDYEFFNVSGINYEVIRGKKKKKKKKNPKGKKKKMEDKTLEKVTDKAV